MVDTGHTQPVSFLSTYLCFFSYFLFSFSLSLLLSFPLPSVFPLIFLVMHFNITALVFIDYYMSVSKLGIRIGKGIKNANMSTM